MILETLEPQENLHARNGLKSPVEDVGCSVNLGYSYGCGTEKRAVVENEIKMHHAEMMKRQEFEFESPKEDVGCSITLGYSYGCGTEKRAIVEEAISKRHAEMRREIDSELDGLHDNVGCSITLGYNYGCGTEKKRDAVVKGVMRRNAGIN